MNVPHREVAVRNQQVYGYYRRGWTRKRIAYNLHISYALVRKIVWTFLDRRKIPDRRRTPR